MLSPVRTPCPPGRLDGEGDGVGDWSAGNWSAGDVDDEDDEGAGVGSRSGFFALSAASSPLNASMDLWQWTRFVPQVAPSADLETPHDWPITMHFVQMGNDFLIARRMAWEYVRPLAKRTLA